MRGSIKGVIEKLKKTHSDVVRYHASAEEGGTEERVEQLEHEIDCIEQAIEIFGGNRIMRSPEDTKYVEGSHIKPSFMIGLPSLGTVSMKFCMAFNRLQIPVNSAITALYVERMEVGVARNFIATEYMKTDPRPKYLFFLGDDMLPGWDALIRLWDEMEKGTWDVLSGLYYLKSDPPSPIIRRVGIPGALVPGVHFKVGEVVDCDVTGMDFCLIKPEVFEKITHPFFKTGYEFTPIDQNGNGNVLQHTEDTFFLKKVREAGMRIGVHTGVRVSHYDNKSGMVF